MPINLASPGILVKEVDLTIGRVDTATDKNGAIVAAFAKGPVDVPTLIENEQELLDTFGKPYGTDNHYESWMVASSYLAYGGVLTVVRADDDDLKNARSGTQNFDVKSLDDYINKGYDEDTITGVVVGARNPGSWGNSLKIGMIDAKVDQIITGLGTNVTGPGNGETTLVVGMGVTQSLEDKQKIGGFTTDKYVKGDYLKGMITEKVGGSGTTTTWGVKVLSKVVGGVETDADYTPGGTLSFTSSGALGFTTAGQTTGIGSTTAYKDASDWFNQQNITLSNGTIDWNTVADRPGTSSYAAARSSRFDEVHIVVVDDDGSISGNAGTILEKNLSLSKAKDAEFSSGSASYWRKFLENSSTTIFGGSAPTGVTTIAYKSGFTTATKVDWDQNAQGVLFAGVGNTTLELSGGKNYDGNTGIGSTGALKSDLGKLVSGYGLFENTEEYDIDFLLMGAASKSKEESQALANKLIAVADVRKDALAFISPYRDSFISNVGSSSASLVAASKVTDNVISFYSPITSSSYAVFDSGYKYMFDRFNNTFRWIPLNGDIAGTCARNDINNFPWFSPAGTARGAILNAVKLGYNPSQVQRDKLYSSRINPVIFSPGAGIVLYGDKTGFGKASAFDRVNVRRLFIYLEDAISAAAKDQLFEFNDEITRTNFVNIVEPFLRDVQAKRGIFDFRVVCDETNNTAAIIDNNEFVADIFIKPARSINFIGLTFVATRTGISFEEVIGTVN